MLQRLWGRLVAKPETDSPPSLLYEATALQARKPVFFERLAFPDTVLGRLDVLHLHLFLLTRRLGISGDQAMRMLSQEVFDRHVEGLDIALRQLGVGDLSVPKKKKRMVREFYGLVASFDRLFDRPDIDAIAGAANARFYGANRPDIARALARCLLATAAGLARQADADLLAGRISWPTSVPERG